MEELKIITDKMVAQNLIADIVVNGKESFKIMEDNIISTESDTQTNKENGGEGIPNLENFINASFYDTIVDLNKGEVKIRN